MFNTHVANLPDTGTVTVCAATSRPSTVFGAYGSLTPGTGFVLIGVTGHKRSTRDTDDQTACAFRAHYVGRRRCENRCSASRRRWLSASDDRFRSSRYRGLSSRIVRFDSNRISYAAVCGAATFISLA